ncbi:MAG: hypothetical protein K0R28_2501 [Paenibacillus sp.]|nr:hypothetical protein [Paenibacillus sp.]
MWEPFLPKEAGNDYRGYAIAKWVFLLLAAIGFVRSCIHLLAPDGGAGSIAGMDVSVAGGDGAVIQLVVFFRYRTLIPFLYALMLVETLLRMLVGQMNPVEFAHTPPGAIGNYVMLPLVAVMLILSLKRKNELELEQH